MRPHTLIHTKLYVHESDDSLRKQETWSQCSLILAELEGMDEEKVGVKGPCNLRRRKRSKNRGKENRRLTHPSLIRPAVAVYPIFSLGPALSRRKLNREPTVKFSLGTPGSRARVAAVLHALPCARRAPPLAGGLPYAAGVASLRASPSKRAKRKEGKMKREPRRTLRALSDRRGKTPRVPLPSCL